MFRLNAATPKASSRDEDYSCLINTALVISTMWIVNNQFKPMASSPNTILFPKNSPILIVAYSQLHKQ